LISRVAFFFLPFSLTTPVLASREYFEDDFIQAESLKLNQSNREKERTKEREEKQPEVNQIVDNNQQRQILH